jgi:hypothetical protein
LISNTLPWAESRCGTLDQRAQGRTYRPKSRTSTLAGAQHQRETRRWLLNQPLNHSQDYTAVAAVDAKAQIIVAVQTLGSCSAQGALIPILETTAHLRTEQTLITADARYHSEENLRPV